MLMHCMIHYETLASKTLGPELMKMQRHVIKLINTVKSSALNTRLFRLFYEQMNTDHYELLYHTEERQLNNVLKQIFALPIELRDFYAALQAGAGKKFCNKMWHHWPIS